MAEDGSIGGMGDGDGFGGWGNAGMFGPRGTYGRDDSGGGGAPGSSAGSAGSDRTGWFGGLGDSYDFGADVLGYYGLEKKQSDISTGNARALSMMTSNLEAAKQLAKDHPWATALGSLLGAFMPGGFGMGLMFAGAAEELQKAAKTGFKTDPAALSGLMDDAMGEAGRGDGARPAAFDALAMAGASAEQATAAKQNTETSGQGADDGLAPETEAAKAAAAEKKAARQRTGLLAMRLTDPWAMLTDAATVFRPGVFA